MKDTRSRSGKLTANNPLYSRLPDDLADIRKNADKKTGYQQFQETELSDECPYKDIIMPEQKIIARMPDLGTECYHIAATETRIDRQSAGLTQNESVWKRIVHAFASPQQNQTDNNQTATAESGQERSGISRRNHQQFFHRLTGIGCAILLIGIAVLFFEREQHSSKESTATAGIETSLPFSAPGEAAHSIAGQFADNMLFSDLPLTGGTETGGLPATQSAFPVSANASPANHAGYTDTGSGIDSHRTAMSYPAGTSTLPGAATEGHSGLVASPFAGQPVASQPVGQIAGLSTENTIESAWNRPPSDSYSPWDVAHRQVEVDSHSVVPGNNFPGNNVSVPNVPVPNVPGNNVPVPVSSPITTAPVVVSASPTPPPAATLSPMIDMSMPVSPYEQQFAAPPAGHSCMPMHTQGVPHQGMPTQGMTPATSFADPFAQAQGVPHVAHHTPMHSTPMHSTPMPQSQATYHPAPHGVSAHGMPYSPGPSGTPYSNRPIVTAPPHPQYMPQEVMQSIQNPIGQANPNAMQQSHPANMPIPSGISVLPTEGSYYQQPLYRMH